MTKSTAEGRAHDHIESIAVAIPARRPRHLATLEAWLQAMRQRLPTAGT